MSESGQVFETCVGDCPKTLLEMTVLIADEVILAVILVTLLLTAQHVWFKRRRRHQIHQKIWWE